MSRIRRFHALPLALSLGLASACALASGQDIDKINGSITAEAGQSYGELSTVNGSIRLRDGSRTGNADTVNGSIRGGDDLQAGSLETVNGSIRLGHRANVSGHVETVNGSIFIDRGSRIGGDVETVNGGIGLVATEVGGNLETVTGDVTVGVGSHVRGGLRVSKPSRSWLPVSFNQRTPRIVIGPNAVVEGDLVFEREVVLYVHKTARIGAVTGATPIPYDTPTSPRD
ncbi:hypothetical protein [Luteimonas vadosa]|uniref:Polymer-forming cytoskeletal protein n=1 Tax=Luteimonas vadosa TaxID=1165507 RepID=A0ABP9DRH7_9GAMM